MTAVVLVGPPPERPCGVAAFTKDLATALTTQGCEVGIAAVLRGGEATADPLVRRHLRQDALRSYARTADQINVSDVDFVNVQHEYALFGGHRGEYVLELYRRLRPPVITTLHTVEPPADPGMKLVTTELCRSSAAVVVLSEAAERILVDQYGVPRAAVTCIPHGHPGIRRGPGEKVLARQAVGSHARQIVLTFGLLRRNRGVEYGISAMTRVLPSFPRARYCVVGQTHPDELRSHGEQYRERLRRLVVLLGLSEHVEFVPRLVTEAELHGWLTAADVGLLPYLDLDQTSSGTLAYFLGANIPVVVSSFRQAVDLASDVRLVPMRDPVAIAAAVVDALGSRPPTDSNQSEQDRAWTVAAWPEVAKRYLRLMSGVTPVALLWPPIDG